MPKEEMDMGDLVGIIYMVIGALTILGSILIVKQWSNISQMIEPSGVMAMILNTDPTMTMFVGLLIGIIEFLGGLLTYLRYEEGRVIVCLLAIPGLVAFPIGTIVALMTWYFLLVKEPIKSEFRRMEL